MTRARGLAGALSPRCFLSLRPLLLAALALCVAQTSRADDLAKAKEALRGLCSGEWLDGAQVCDVSGMTYAPGVRSFGYSSYTVNDARERSSPEAREEVSVGGSPAVLCYVYSPTYSPAGKSICFFTATVTWGVKFPNGLPYHYSVSAISEWRDGVGNSNTDWPVQRADAKRRAMAHAEVVDAAIRGALGLAPAVGGPPAQRLCDEARERLRDASLKAKLAAYRLQSCRALIQDLDREWEDRREAAYWSGTIDVATMAGSALTRPIAGAIGTVIADQTLKMALIEAALKGVAKEGMKQYAASCAQQGVDPAALLYEVSVKGAGVDVRDKAVQEAVQHYLTEEILRKASAGEMGGLQALQMAAHGPDDTLTGGVSPKMREFVKSQFAAPAAELLGTMISFQAAMDGAWTAHGSLEAIRQALSIYRGAEIRRAQEADAALQELDLARHAFNRCVELHPAEKEGGDPALAFRPDVTPPPPRQTRPEGGGSLTRSGDSGQAPAVTLPSGPHELSTAAQPTGIPLVAVAAPTGAAPTFAEPTGLPNPGAASSGPASDAGTFGAAEPGHDPPPPAAASTPPSHRLPDDLGQPCAPSDAFIASLYRSVLEREPDPTGLQGFARSLASGTSREQLYRDFFGSAEYAGKRKSDLEFLRDCYQAILGREPGESDTALWAPKLLLGKISRPALLSAILGSEEFKRIRAGCR